VLQGEAGVRKGDREREEMGEIKELYWVTAKQLTPLSLPSPFAFISSSPMKGACGTGFVRKYP
jgi:hypothetical protein